MTGVWGRKSQIVIWILKRLSLLLPLYGNKKKTSTILWSLIILRRTIFLNTSSIEQKTEAHFNIAKYLQQLNMSR